jgi:hypothetical protein
MKPLLRASLGLASTLLCIAASPRVALAQPDFPTVVQEVLGMDAAPGCELCHTGGSQSKASANSDFVLALQSNGLDFSQNIEAEQIRTATQTANDAGDPAIVKAKGGKSAEYGCFEQKSSIAASRAPAPRVFSLALAALVGGLLFLRRRR